ncbi:AAA family ATPase [Trichothermofontia sp.]
MLREYKLKNFKAFADVAPLLIRPITLLYGPNSAGKSSIIQSLMLLKQTLDDQISTYIADWLEFSRQQREQQQQNPSPARLHLRQMQANQTDNQTVIEVTSSL